MGIENKKKLKVNFFELSPFFIWKSHYVDMLKISDPKFFDTK